MSDQNATEEFVENLLNDLKSVYSGRSLDEITKIICESFSTSATVSHQFANFKARKLAEDMGYIYHNGEKGRPDNWDRGYVLKRNGMEDGVKANSEGWRWAERGVNTTHDIIGIRTDPPQPSKEMTLQGLWLWYKCSPFIVEFCSVTNGAMEWIVTIDCNTTSHSGELHDVLAKLRDMFIECDGDSARVAERLSEIQNK